MAYCTTEDVVATYGAEHLAQLTGDPQGLTPTTEKIDRAVADYGDYMETFVRMQHPDNPFDAEHALLRQLNVDGAYLLLTRRNPARGGVLDEDYRAEQKRLDDLLARIGRGDVVLMTDAEKAAAPTDKIDPSEALVANERVFGGHRTRVVLT